MENLRVRIVGTGRAGGALEIALANAAGIRLQTSLRHGDDLQLAARNVDIVLLAVPDAAIAAVSESIATNPNTVIAHISGATTLEALLPHSRRASIHPLVPIGDPVSGAAALVGAWVAVSGDPLIEDLARALLAKIVRVAEADRSTYHAAAVIASNHLIALMGQVERVAATVGVPLEAYLDLATEALASTRRIGPERALPGPVSRGDWQTVRAHINALAAEERPAYIAMAQQAAILARRDWPADIE